jgi:hypothetical protein
LAERCRSRWPKMISASLGVSSAPNLTVDSTSCVTCEGVGCCHNKVRWHLVVLIIQHHRRMGIHETRALQSARATHKRKGARPQLTLP